MNTSLFFEVYASGMRAKLDPTYRQRLGNKLLSDRAERLGKMARNSRQPLAPFTTVRKSYQLFDR